MQPPHLAPLADPENFLKHLYQVAVARALPGKILADYLPPPPKGRTVVIGAGKAAGSMALAIEQAWPESAPMSGLLITRYHHTPPGYLSYCDELKRRGKGTTGGTRRGFTSGARPGGSGRNSPAD